MFDIFDIKSVQHNWSEFKPPRLRQSCNRTVTSKLISLVDVGLLNCFSFGLNVLLRKVVGLGLLIQIAISVVFWNNNVYVLTLITKKSLPIYSEGVAYMHTKMKFRL